MYRISIPLYVETERKTKKNRRDIINMNNYRNWHYLISNNIKKRYKDNLCFLDGVKLKTPIFLLFLLFKGNKRISDRSNVLSIHEKFFCDALTEYGCIEDDNDSNIFGSNYFTMGIDKENPRVEVIILENE